MQPLITVFCAFTRPWAVERWLQDLENSGLYTPRTNLAFIVDIDDPRIAMALQGYAKNRNYASFEMIVNHEWAPNEVRIAVRRRRIAEVKNQSKELIKRHPSDYVLALEDDTVFSNKDIFKPLIESIVGDDTIGLIEGVQVGRWNTRYVGAWRFDDVHDPKEARTIRLNKYSPDFQPIHAGGFYGYITPTKLYLEHEYNWEGEPWGPDVNYGLWLSRNNYKCFIHWPTIFGHNDFNQVLYPTKQPDKIRYLKNVEGKWDLITSKGR